MMQLHLSYFHKEALKSILRGAGMLFKMVVGRSTCIPGVL